MELFFKYLVSTIEKKADNGVGIVMHFPNNFGASIVRDEHSVGGEFGNYEIAVLYNGSIHYDNPVAKGDVLGHIMHYQIEGILLQIKGLDDPYGFEAFDKESSSVLHLRKELAELDDQYKEGYTLIQWPESQEYHDIDKYPDCIVANEDGYGNKGNGPGGTFVPNKYLCKE
jgi:hypothetical protein